MMRNPHRLRWGFFSKRSRIMKEKEKENTPIPWECKDPKPPVIQSGRMENRRVY